MFFFPRFLLSFYIFGVAIIIYCFATSFVFGATLVPNEVLTLKKIGNKLGKKWNFSVDPCSGQSGWTTFLPLVKGFGNNVNCSCNGTLCHVVAIVLKAQNLSGVLPTELIELPHLQVFDVTRNYLNGTIPREWGSTNLVNITIQGNRLTGPIPNEIGNISNLTNFVADDNQLSGVLPAELGNLPRIEKLFLTANNFTGKLNESFANLITMKDFWIGGNNFTGKIPDFITKWTNLTRLVIQGSGLDGPIPSDIRLLTKMTDLRISDLNGAESPFPQLDTMTGLKSLVLRSCNIYGHLPKYFPKMTSLQFLDLSFNNLRGEIPSDYSLLVGSKAKFIYLTGNLFTGPVPAWTLEGGQNVDLSYNNFTDENVDTCQRGSSMNLFGSSLKGNKSGISCLGENVCREMQSYFHINCGGKAISEGDITYIDDLNGAGASNFYRSPTNWAFSSTGYFPDDASDPDLYTLRNSSPLMTFRLYLDACLSALSLSYSGFLRGSFHINCGGKNVSEGGITYEDDMSGGGPSNFYQRATNWASSSTGYFPDDNHTQDTYTLSSPSVSISPIYKDARLSPLSLTYYGFCLINGNYTVNLHFAEIKFTDDKTYNSLGRRIFDVYIQGVRVLKDFNIENTAGGVDKKVVKLFTVPVTNNTLEIRLYWAGKGTTATPSRGVFGPLISAISAVGPDSKPAKHGGISVGAVVGIVVSVVTLVVLLVMGVLWWKGRLQRAEVEYELRGLDLQTGSFSLRQIKAATNNFDIANKIGEGGFGSVYKGLLSDGTEIAVKQLSAKSKQGNREFVNEIGMISALQHPHLVKLHGCCMEGNQLLLVYEYMENNCLAHALFGPEESQLILDWPTRHKICVGIAKGLAYLHEESRLKIVHRDIKATNVLLDKNLNSKISDFGLAKLDEEDNTHISTRIAGTFGYMAPEYAMRGYLTDKADVYSFGIVALEIVSGRNNTSFKSRLNSFYLLDWALVLKEMNRLEELIDPKLGNDYNKNEVMAMINVALLCTNVSPAVRPSMSSVVRMLEGRDIVKEITSDALISYQEMNLQAMKNHYQENQEQSLIRDQIHTDVPWTESSFFYISC